MTASFAQRPSGMPCHRYSPFPSVDLPDRTWPTKTITAAPRWLSTDLRDGNQALIDPMNASPQERDVRPARPHGLQGDRGRLPGRVADRLRLRPLAHRARPGTRRRPHLGPDPGPRGAHRAHRPVACGSEAGDRAHVQRRRAGLPPRRVRLRGRRAGAVPRGRRRRHPGDHEVRRHPPGRHRVRVGVLPRDLHGHRARLLPRHLRGRDGRLAARARPRDRDQPALHGRTLDPERLRRPDRVDEPALLAPRARLPLRPHPQRPGDGHRRRRAGRAGRRAAHRGLPVRQRRAQRQRRPGDPGPEPVQPGHRPDDRLQ